MPLSCLVCAGKRWRSHTQPGPELQGWRKALLGGTRCAFSGESHFLVLRRPSWIARLKALFSPYKSAPPEPNLSPLSYGLLHEGICGMFDPREKIALFIDGANLYATSKALGFDIDYRKLLNTFQKRGYLLRAYYYTALVEDQEYSSIRPLIDWLDYNGYKVVTKPAKEFTDSTGRRKIKGNMDIELTIDALELVKHVDHYVIFSGDGDFRTLVEALQRKGRKVSIVSTMASQPPMISDDLRRQSDYFIDLMTLKSEVGRDPSERPARRAEPAEVEDDEYS
jgi:uncharacterized LabA/DUF88 family protein